MRMHGDFCYQTDIGNKRKVELLKKFKNVTEMKKKSIEELESVLPRKVAEELYDYLKNME